MVTKKIMLMLGFVLLVLLSSGSVCASHSIDYTEWDDTEDDYTMTQSTSFQNVASCFDENWGTYGYSQCGICSEIIDYEYNKPSWADFINSWEVKYDNNDDPLTTKNLTITEDCYDFYNDKVKLRTLLSQSSSVSTISFQCYNGAWHTILSDSATTTVDDNKFYEERVEWANYSNTLPSQPPIFTIYPETAYTADDLYADFTSTDADNDTIVFNWNWSNGTTEAIRFIDDGSLVSYYAMDDTEASTVYDYSGSNDGTMSGYTQNNGARNGGVEISTDDGKYGYGSGFDGDDDYIDLNSNFGFNSSMDFTISMWAMINLDAANYNILLGRYDGSAEILKLELASGNYNFQIGKVGGSRRTVSTPATYGDWVFITAVYTPATSYIYVNGTLKNSNSAAVTDFADATEIHIGNRGGDNSGDTNGSIDEVRIWNRTLTQTEIQAEMDSSNPVKGDGLVASYSFEQHNSTHALDTNHLVKGEIAEGITFDGVDDYIGTTFHDVDGNKQTISFWAKTNSLSPSSNKYVLDSSPSGGGYLARQHSGGNTMEIYRVYNVEGAEKDTVNIPDTNWHFYTMVANETSVEAFIDGVSSGSPAIIAPDTFSLSTVNMKIGSSLEGSEFWNGSLDEVQIYNKSLLESEIKALYEGSRHYSNGTHAELDSSFTSTFDTWTLDVTPYDYTVGGTLREVYAYIDDTLAPEITTDNISLNKTIVYSNDNLTAQINATDNFLYSINVSIDDVSIFNTSGIGATNYVYNLSQNMSSYSVGEHNISFRACDGHTSNQLNDKWNYDVGLSGLTFKDDKDKNKWYRINPTNNDIFERITTTRLKDRYDFKYQKSRVGKLFSKATEYSFIVESTEYIDIINPQQTDYKYKDKYKAWLVIKDIGQNGRWIDFNLKDVPEARYTITRLSKTKVEITISNIPRNMKELVFESTGELNCVTETYEFYVYNYTTSYTTPVLETSSQTFTLNITRDSDYITNANATLHYNGTAYTPTETTNGTYFYYTKTITMPSVDANTNVTFNWTYTLEGEENTTSRTASETQLIYNIDMDDCSTYNITALNFSLVEESNNASINGSMDFTFSLAQEGTTVAYSKSVTDRNWTAFCIPNNDIDFTAQLQSEYSAEGYDAHTYFAYNLAITNATQYITYYLTNGTTIVEFTVLDQNGDKVEDAYIKVKKYDIGTGTYKTIETLKTDEQGKALGNIILDTAWYEFVVEYGGTVYLEDGPTKITTTSRTFRINLLTDFFARYTDVIYGITSSLNYTDATGNFRFTWSDPDGNYHYGCLKVTKESLTGNTLINETCVQSTAGTILININDSGSVNGTYVAVGYIKFDEPYVLQVLRKTWGSLSEKYGKEGLFYAFLIILTVAMVGIFAPKVAMILAVIGLVFSSMLGFFNMNPSWIIALVIAAGLTIYRMRD